MAIAPFWFSADDLFRAYFSTQIWINPRSWIPAIMNSDSGTSGNYHGNHFTTNENKEFPGCYYW